MWGWHFTTTPGSPLIDAFTSLPIFRIKKSCFCCFNCRVGELTFPKACTYIIMYKGWKAQLSPRWTNFIFELMPALWCSYAVPTTSLSDIMKRKMSEHRREVRNNLADHCRTSKFTLRLGQKSGFRAVTVPRITCSDDDEPSSGFRRHRIYSSEGIERVSAGLSPVCWNQATYGPWDLQSCCRYKRQNWVYFQFKW